MSLKLSKVFEKENKLTEELGDFDKALGKTLFLNAESVMVFEDYMPEGDEGEIKRRPTDIIEYYEVNIYSEGQGQQIIVKMPADIDFSDFNYEEEVKLINRSLNFWSDKEIVSNGNGQFRTNYFSGQKWNAEGIEKVNKAQTTSATPKSENKSNEQKK
ncbi:MAG: YdcP family protein [Lactococcus lactis]|nr:YdcP family protein [Lactococcus lactis]